jgi:hypothetical protein
MDPRIPRTQSQPNVNQAVCLEFLNWKVSTGSSRAHAHAHSRHSRSTLVGDPPTYQDSCSIPIHPSNDRSLIDIPHSMHFHANTGFPLCLRVRPSCPRKLDRFRSAHNPPPSTFWNGRTCHGDRPSSTLRTSPWVPTDWSAAARECPGAHVPPLAIHRGEPTKRGKHEIR